MTAFYVYEHIRPDTGVVFYVGKGTGKRKSQTGNRNKYWKSIVAKNNNEFQISVLCEVEDEELAFLIEQERIDQLTRLGIKLSNMTSGGEGCSGLKHSKASRLKMSDAHIGEKNAKYGVKNSTLTREKISKALTGRKRSKEVCQKFSESRRGKNHPLYGKVGVNNPSYGKKRSEETKLKQSIAYHNAELKKCFVCGHEAKQGPINLHHNNNCKLKQGIEALKNPTTATGTPWNTAA